MIGTVRRTLTALAYSLVLLLAVPVGLNTYMPFYVIESDSMVPAYRPGSVVFVHRHMPGDLGRLTGKGIVYYDQAGGRVIAHRVIAVQGKYLVTQGDNNPAPDTFRPTAEDILGIVWGVKY